MFIVISARDGDDATARNEIMETSVARLTSSITQNSITFRCRHFVYC